MPPARHPTRRSLVAGTATALAVATLASGSPAVAWQSIRELLGLLVTQEQTQVTHYTALLDTFDDAAFANAGLPAGVRSGIATVLTADQIHLATLETPEQGTPAALPVPTLTDIGVALRQAIEIENLSVATYALVIPLVQRERLIPDLLGIHSVDARHAAWLAAVASENPFPRAIDPALTLEESSPEEAQPLAVPPQATPEANADVQPALEAIARELDVSPDALDVVEVTTEVWPDSSLGCPKPGMLYAQVVTRGFRIVVKVAGERIEFHADRRGGIVRCP